MARDGFLDLIQVSRRRGCFVFSPGLTPRLQIPNSGMDRTQVNGNKHGEVAEQFPQAPLLGCRTIVESCWIDFRSQMQEDPHLVLKFSDQFFLAENHFRLLAFTRVYFSAFMVART